MELAVGEWFQLPFLGSDVFAGLMRARLQYDRATRRFMITDRTNTDQILTILSSALKEPVKLRVEVRNPACFVCDADVHCEVCRYMEFCPRTPPYCLCAKHSGQFSDFKEYNRKFTESAQLESPPKEVGSEKHKPLNDMWTEKYRPAHIMQMVGNERSRIEFLKWLQKWKAGAKPALLIGPPGTGKTTLVTVAARNLYYELIQLNASDERSKGRLEKTLLPGIVNQSLVTDWDAPKKQTAKRLIFLDEVDGLLGRQDFGAASYLKELIPISQYPIVMAANDEDSDVVRQIAGQDFGAAQTLRFARALPRQAEFYLREILRREGLEVSDDSMGKIVERANGDMRAAINNLEMVARNPDSARILVYRDEQIPVREAMKRMLSAKNQGEMYEALDILPISDLRELMQLAAVNLVANPVSPKARAEALSELSRLDMLIRRIQATQNWTLLRYVRRILAGILFNAKNDDWRMLEDDPDFSRIRFRVWNDRRVILECGRRIAEKTHTSTSTALVSVYPYLLVTLASDSKKELEKLVAFDEASQRVTDRELQRIENLLEAAPEPTTRRK